MLDWLKPILGDAHTEDIEKKIETEIGKNFVARADFNTKNETLKTVQEQLTQANETIAGFKDLDIDSIKKSAEEWKQKAEQAEKDAAEKIAAIQFDNMLNTAITSAKGKNTKAIAALLDVDALKASKNQETDIKAALEAVKENNSYMFDDDTPIPSFGGPTPGPKPNSGIDAIRAAAGLNPSEQSQKG